MAASINALKASRSSRRANLWVKVTGIMVRSPEPSERVTSPDTPI
jgi:hypothetical protein